jgi:hypothetical protein
MTHSVMLLVIVLSVIILGVEYFLYAERLYAEFPWGPPYFGDSKNFGFVFFWHEIDPP